MGHLPVFINHYTDIIFAAITPVLVHHAAESLPTAAAASAAKKLLPPAAWPLFQQVSVSEGAGCTGQGLH